MISKKVTFLLRRPPSDSVNTLEMLDAILVAGVFEQSVSVLFKDQAVLLLGKSLSEDAELRHTQTIISSFQSYGINDLYACAASLDAMGLSVERLIAPVEPLSNDQQFKKLAEQDAVLSD